MNAALQLETPLGGMTLLSDGEGLLSARFDGGPMAPPSFPPDALCVQAAAQLREYFNGQRTAFDLPLHPIGTAFQRQVWAALLKIPYGETRSYGEIARAIGNEKAVRAVGQAIHRNPLLILIPCHRVLGADGSLTGFAAGLERKKALLALERKQLGMRSEE